MEEKYLYTIAIVVIFAGFLFTSVGTYTGRLVSSTNNEPSDNTWANRVITSGQSTGVGSAITKGFYDDVADSPAQRTNCDGYVCCEASQEGQQRVTDRNTGQYTICAGGKRLPQSCPDYSIAIQRTDGVSCSSRETSPRY